MKQKQQIDEPTPDAERQFHEGEGHKVPLVIILVWTVLIIWCVFYVVKYSVPDLMQNWLK